VDDLSQAEYYVMQQRVEMLSRLLIATDPERLAAFVAQAERADSIAPVLDPTAWIAGHDRLRVVIEHARAMAKARKAIVEAADRAGVAT
jgi:hypothetical protein